MIKQVDKNLIYFVRLSDLEGLDPTATRPLEALGDVHFALRNYARAADSYADFVRLDDRSTRVLYKLALTRYRGGDPGGAVQPLRQAVALDDRFAEAHYLLGLCLHSTKRPQEALSAFVRAIGVMPSLVVAHEELAWLHRVHGRTRQALEQLEILTSLDPRPARFVALGLEYARTGQSEQATRTLGTAAERFPGSRESTQRSAKSGWRTPRGAVTASPSARLWRRCSRCRRTPSKAPPRTRYSHRRRLHPAVHAHRAVLPSLRHGVGVQYRRLRQLFVGD